MPQLSLASDLQPRSSAGLIDERTERRLAWLLFGRLLLSLLSFGIAIGLDGFGPELSDAARRGLYWSVAFAFLATVLSGVWFGRIRDANRFALIQIAADVLIVTSLVHFSGGRESVFVFLYALVTVYGSLLFERRGGMLAAGFSAVAYAGALVASNEGWLLGFELDNQIRSDPFAEAKLLGTWAVHVGALFLVGALASVLSVELYQTGRALDQSTSDLKRLRDLHQYTVASLMSGLLTTDLDAVITTFNPEAERILGVTAADVLGKHIDEVIPGARELALIERRHHQLASPSRSRISRINPNGEKRFLGLAGSILKDVDGSAAGHTVIFQDVTRVVAMEEELRRSERLAAVGEMSAKMAHEIRNPLAAISGSIQILQQGLQRAPDDLDSSESEVSRLMAIVVRETERLSRLLGDFLQYSRPGPLMRKSVELAGLIREVASALEATLPASISLEMRGLTTVVASVDSDQLRQVVWNLIINAIEAMPRGGILTLSSYSESGPARQVVQGGDAVGRNDAEARNDGSSRQCEWATIVVEDTGDGMSPEEQEQIFEPFYTTKEKGSGLGLATVHRIVESHGGALELSSEIGRGTRVSLRLPSAEAQG